MRCCSFRVRLYIRLDSRVCVCMYVRMCVCGVYACVCVCVRACVYTLAPRFTCGACVCIPRCTCTNCRTIRVQTLSLSSFSPSFSSLPPSPPLPTYLPTSLLRTPTPSVSQCLSLSLCFPPFLSRVSPSSATCIRVYVLLSFPSVHTHATHTPRIATALRTLLFSSSSLDSRLLCHGNGVIQGSARARARNT